MVTSRCIWFAGLGLLCAAGCGRERVAPPLPHARAAWVDSLPPVPTSYLDVPVRYDLRPALQWLEHEVPRELGQLDERHTAPENHRLEYAYAVRRSPFHVAVEGRTATLQADLEYRARAWYHPPLLPAIGASCGLDGEGPRARLTLETTVQLTSAWTLRPETRAIVAPLANADRDRCRITLLKIDVTDKIVAAAQAALQQKLAGFDARLAAFDLPGESGRIWRTLSSPLALGDSLWLVIHPSAVRIGLLRMRGDTLVTTVGLSANPRVMGGPKPRVVPSPIPPPEDSTSRPPELHLLTEARIPYDVASTILTKELRGTKLRVASQRLVIDSLRLAGVGDGRVAVGLSVGGPVEGVLYAVGRPAFDTARAELYLQQLEYDVGTRDLLTGTLAWLADGAVEQFLRDKARLRLGGVMSDGQALLERNLNRDLADGVHLRMDVKRGSVLNVRASPFAVLVRAVASGRGDLVLDMRPEQLIGSESLGGTVGIGRGGGAEAGSTK